MKKIIFLSIILIIIFMGGCDQGHSIKDEATKTLERQYNKTLNDFKNNLMTEPTPNISKDENYELINSKTNEENYAFVNDNKASLTKEDYEIISQKGENEFWAEYSVLDQLGRGGKVTALLTYETMISHSSKMKERPQFASNVHVAGEYKDGTFDPIKQTWKGTKSNNQILELEGYTGYIYNKSHSLAWSLGGDMETHNLTLGTRYQNVGSNKASEGGGMGYPETQVRNALYNNPKTKVYYDVNPIYQSDELLPRGTQVRAYSINDNGKTVNLNVWIANKQNGLKLNYRDGTYEF